MTGGGAHAWQQMLADGESNTSSGLAFDPAGALLVAGRSRNTLAIAMRVFKLSRASGAVFDARLDAASANAMQADSQGNVIVAGAANGAMSTSSTPPHVAGCGAQFHRQRPARLGRAIALDAQNNVIVTGTADGSHSHTDMRTVKYAATNGVELWSVGFNNGGVRESIVNYGYTVLPVAAGIYR